MSDTPLSDFTSEGLKILMAQNDAKHTFLRKELQNLDMQQTFLLQGQRKLNDDISAVLKLKEEIEQEILSREVVKELRIAAASLQNLIAVLDTETVKIADLPNLNDTKIRMLKFLRDDREKLCVLLEEIQSLM